MGAGRSLTQALAPGDIFLLRGGGRLAGIGAAGGMFGHVMVATSRPQGVRLGTPEAEALRPVWPNGEDVLEVWRVGTIESTRREHGLHETDSIFAVDSCTGAITLVGECSRQGELTAIECCELVVVWKAPAELRALVAPGIVQEVVAGMKAQMREANWSMLTAARAAFQDAALDGESTMEEVEACWRNGPICTSVAIICWQRCLCQAATGGQCAAELILRWMPLKADRALPSDLVCTLLATGWGLVERVGEPDPSYKPRFTELLAWPGEVRVGETISL